MHPILRAYNEKNWTKFCDGSFSTTGECTTRRVYSVLYSSSIFNYRCQIMLNNWRNINLYLRIKWVLNSFRSGWHQIMETEEVIFLFSRLQHFRWPCQMQQIWSPQTLWSIVSSMLNGPQCYKWDTSYSEALNLLKTPQQSLKNQFQREWSNPELNLKPVNILMWKSECI